MAEHKRNLTYELGTVLVKGRTRTGGEWEVLPPVREPIDQPVACAHGGLCNVTASAPDETGRYELYCQECWYDGVKVWKGWRVE